ncbi:cation diffusion facilitator family transporter [Niallia sp. FSL W8-0635]|uniref:cation diffusion facilitator family transporter n=1 Tax=Niallia sp. FSL W8-0635 TaxID=2975337 RepID=UPI002B015396|nr:cation diffusion facilitator family transporter [Yersinia enterocolitica]
MKEFIFLLKNGNRSALLAALVNTIISIIKGFAFFLSGNVAMFAETMHSLGDAANQFFVFIGSALSKKAPTKRFPGGFGRLVNVVLLFAVLIVGIMAYETIREGIDHVIRPQESTGFFLIIIVLSISVSLEFIVLIKAMKEIVTNAGLKTKGWKLLTTSFAYLKSAKPATKLVFLEDSVATAGGLLAILAVVISEYTNFKQAEGIASIIIGIFMFIIVGRVFLDNAAGAIGEADLEMQGVIGNIAMKDPDVRDIQGLAVYKEGEDFHVELSIEIDSKLTVEQADNIRQRIEKQIFTEKGVSDIIIEFDKDDGILNWPHSIHKYEKRKKILEKHSSWKNVD